MSNHYHLVVRLDVEKAHALSEVEVIARYSRLFKVPLLVERYLVGLTSEAENLVAQKILGQWRERLCDLSWYMRGLNEYLARRANAEDGCKGRFWTVERIRRMQPQPNSAPQEAEDRVSAEARQRAATLDALSQSQSRRSHARVGLHRARLPRSSRLGRSSHSRQLTRRHS